MFAAVLLMHELRTIFCSVVNVIDYTADLSALLGNMINTVGNPSLLCVLGSHLLIHLKEAADEGRNEGTSYRSKSISIIEFDQGVGSSELSKHGQFFAWLKSDWPIDCLHSGTVGKSQASADTYAAVWAWVLLPACLSIYEDQNLLSCIVIVNAAPPSVTCFKFACLNLLEYACALRS